MLNEKNTNNTCKQLCFTIKLHQPPPTNMSIKLGKKENYIVTVQHIT